MHTLYVRILALLLILGLPVSSLAEPAKYSVTDESWSPYWIIEAEQVSGILSDFMQQLEALIDVPLVENRPLPVKRAQHFFEKGDLQIECCVNEIWRASPEQVEVSLWSDVVMEVEEVLIFPPGKTFDFNSLEDLKGRSVATVRGYGYAGSEFFKRSDSGDNLSQIQKVALGRTDAGIIDKTELFFVLKNSRVLKEQNVQIEIGPVINRSELKVRVHTSRPELLGPINAAIAKMKQNGAILKIVDSYIR